MAAENTQELTLIDMFSIYRRRRVIVYGTTLALLVLVAAYCVVCTRKYQSTGSIEIQKQSPDSAGFGGLINGSGADASDSLALNIEVQTQASILQSDSLALQTVKALKMEDTPDFRVRWNPINWVMGLVSPSGVPDPANATIDNSPGRRARALKVFSKNLAVKPVAGTRIIDITYTSSDRQQAAAVVNALTQELLDYTFQTRYNATNETSKWLSEQLGDLRKNSEDLQAKVVNLQRESGVYSLGSLDAQGHEQAYSAVIDKLQQSTAAVTAAEQNRILKEAIAKAAQAGNGELLSGLAGNATTGGTGATANSLIVLQNLRQQEATQQSALGEAKAKYGSSYPKIAELEGSIDGLQRSIDQEASRLKGRAQSDYEVARRAEEKTLYEYDQSKKRADVLNNKAIEFAIVRQEAEQGRTLYEDMLRRVNEAGVLAGLRSSNITVVDPGRIPARPTKPNVPLYLGGSLIAGWILGCFGALIADTLDQKLNTISDLEKIHGGMLLGALPLEKPLARGEVIPGQVLLPNGSLSSYIEVIKSIRTTLLLSRINRPKVLLITSSIAGEGKSTCALNLAAVSAQSGKKTLIIDADLRRGSVRERLDIPNGPGLGELLDGSASIAPIIPAPGIPNLDVLTAGTTIANPADLFASDTMRDWLEKWRSDYDLVVLDTVPVLPVTDAVVLNTLSDATILIARNYMTEKSQIERSYNILRESGKHQVGIVMNALNPTDSSYFGYYGNKTSDYRMEKGA